MSEVLKRRLAGAAVLLAVFSLIAWWIGSKDDHSGELPSANAQIRNYDIRELDRIALAQEAQQALPEPVPDLPVNEAGTGSEAAVAKAGEPENVNELASEPESAPEAVVAKEQKPEPVVAKTESKPEPVTKPQAEKITDNKPAVDAKGEWIVQVSSVTQKSSAQALADRLKGKGWQSFLTEAEVNGQTYYRVRVGPYALRNTADKAAEGLKQELGQDVAVMTR